MAGISTHVLDSTQGKPIHGVTIELYDLDTTPPTLLNKTASNADGRTDAPVLAPDAARPGRFELRFHVGPYFEARGETAPLAQEVLVRFNVFDAKQHYHVPLLCSPWAFSTCRGS